MNKRVSKREQFIRDLLKEKWPDEKVLYNYRPDWLINPKTGHKLELDIYYPNLRLAFEIQGIHHQLMYQKYKDGIKDIECHKRGIKLEKLAMKKNCFNGFLKRYNLDGRGFRFQTRNPRRRSIMFPYWKETTKQIKREIWPRRLKICERIQNAEIKGNLERMRAKGVVPQSSSH